MTPESRYERLVRRTQADVRIPALSVALHRADRPLWTFQVGRTGTRRPLDQHTQFRIGSVTKTFTAVLVMQCRDDGLLDLDDPISAHLPGVAHGELTIARLLSHTAGLQREPHGDVWDSLRAPDLPTLVDELALAERVLPTGRRFHYSNLGFAMLGHLAARLRGGSWFEVLAERVLEPLDLDATTLDADPDLAATGYLVDTYSDHAVAEPATHFGAVSPAAQLWSTPSDLARWAAFLADPAALDPDGAVLAAATLDEMRWPRTVSDEQVWSAGFGLGLLLQPQPARHPGDRIVHVGHDGAMPGFLASVYGRRGGTDTPGACGVAVFGSSGAGSGIFELPGALLAATVEHDPPDVAAWQPGEPAPAWCRTALGRWWSEGYEFVFFWQGGSLRARGVDDPAGKPPSIFEPLDADAARPASARSGAARSGAPRSDDAGTDVLRTVSGREAGELLRLTRGPAGEVVRMHWATYRFTRVQETFEGVPATGR